MFIDILTLNTAWKRLTDSLRTELILSKGVTVDSANAHKPATEIHNNL